MNKVLVSLIICAILVIGSCSKSSNNGSTRAQFKWTYAGATFTADTVTAANANSVTSNYEIYAQDGPWTTPSLSFDILLTSFRPTSYGNGSNSFNTFNSSTGRDDVSPFSVTITSADNNLLTGTFSGTWDGQPLTGSFSNVAIH